MNPGRLFFLPALEAVTMCASQVWAQSRSGYRRYCGCAGGGAVDSAVSAFAGCEVICRLNVRVEVGFGL